jgi:hypothetical protein
MTGDELLKAVTDLREDVIFCGVGSGTKVHEYYFKPNSPFPLPGQKDMERMVLQSQIMTSILQTNEKVVGKSRFLIIAHADINSILIPLRDDSVMGVTFLEFKEIENRVMQILDLVGPLTKAQKV